MNKRMTMFPEAQIEAPPLTINFVFPRPLPEVELETVPDLTGFTRPEKTTLRNFWRVSNPILRKTIEDIYLDFFTLNELCIEDFRRIDEEKKINTESLTKFVGRFFYLMRSVISKGLDQGSYIKVLMLEKIKEQMPLDLTVDHMEMFVLFLEDYLVEHPHLLPTPTLTDATRKLCHMIAEVYSKRFTKVYNRLFNF